MLPHAWSAQQTPLGTPAEAGLVSIVGEGCLRRAAGDDSPAVSMREAPGEAVVSHSSALRAAFGPGEEGRLRTSRPTGAPECWQEGS